MVLTVTGATGCVGSAVVERALALGHSVRSLSHRRATSCVPGVAAIPTPLTPQSLLGHFEGADAIIHLAAKVHVRKPTPADHDEFRRVNVDGTEAVVRAAERAGVPRIVFASTVGVYGTTGNGPVHDGDPTAPADAYARSKLEAERLIPREGTPAGTILRLSVVSGPRDRGNIRRMIEAIDRRRFVIVGSGDNRKTMLAADNAADRILKAAQATLGPGPWITADPQTWTLRQIVEELARLLSRVRPVRVPMPVALAAAALVDRVARVVGLEPQIARALTKLAQPTHFVSAALDEELGGAAPLSTSEGLERAVRAYRGERRAS